MLAPLPTRVLSRPAVTVLAMLAALPPAHAADLPFETTPVVTAEAPLERLFDGTVEAVNQATVSAQTAGRIAEVFYDVDDYVQSGEPIMHFSNVEQQSTLRQAQAALAEAGARRSQADEEFRRVEGLFESGSASKREYDQALAARDSATARVNAARSAVASAEQQLEYTVVRAPYAGIVTQRHVEVGEAVVVGQALMSGLSLEALRVVVDLPQQTAALVREHRKAFVVTEAGRLEAADVTLFPFAHDESNTFRVRLELPEGQFSLYPGMFVKVAFVVGESQRRLVPTSTLVHRSEVTGVYVVDADNRVRLRQVRTGATFGDQTEILAGLLEGERVASDPVLAGIYVKTRAVAENER